ncbi:MAG: deoxyribonuclease IV [Syntrophobacterales bacterium]
MPLLGAHMSIAGGLHLAFTRIKKVQGRALQIFTKNQRQWQTPPLNREMVALFRKHWEESGRMPVAAHDSYLINLAATDPLILEKSVTGFADELHRAAALGIPFLITHPGSHLGQGLETGLDQFIRNLDRAIALSKTSTVSVLIETTAGQGTNLGSSFEEIAYILSNSQHGDALGVCFDTSHAFAAGYDIRTHETYAHTFASFDQIIGLHRLKFFHINDSKQPLGSRVDRHEHIGKGKIGLEGFRLLLNDGKFQRHPMVLETPKGKDLKEDKKNLKVLRSLIKTKGGRS